jgi:hypothetical protein
MRVLASVQPLLIAALVLFRRSFPLDLREVLRTCSNAKVAEAALISIGGDLSTVVAAEAANRGVSPGGFVAKLVRDFERNVGTCVWARAEQAMRGADQPLLAGLYAIVAHGLLAHNLRSALKAGERSARLSFEKTELMVA